jgi:hypothetical protein
VLSDALEYRSAEVNELRAALDDHHRQLLECRDALREAREDIDGPRGVTRLGSDKGKESADGGRVFSDRGSVGAGHRASRGSGNQIEPSCRSGDSSGVDAAALKQLREELASLADARAESERALEDAEGRKRLAEREMQDVGTEIGKNSNNLVFSRIGKRGDSSLHVLLGDVLTSRPASQRGCSR